jgi:hypothetical protein
MEKIRNVWFVSRQKYYYSGLLMVEVARGGLDYGGSDMLCSQFPGEGKEYSDPREAVEVALSIASLWRATKPGKRVNVGAGCTLGMGLEFEPSKAKELKDWADKAYDKLPKCDTCGEVLGGVTYTLWDLDPDLRFCREYCAEKYEAANLAEQED